MKKKQRQRLSERERKEDRLSDLPDAVLLHIMKFISTKYVVRTCVLSKRFKDLWKGLTEFSLHSSDFTSLSRFEIFVYRVLICRDKLVILHSLDFSRHGCIDSTFLRAVIHFAVFHNVQKLTIHVNLDVMHDFELPQFTFSCPSLTFLKLSVQSITRMMLKFPKSLELPALKVLHLMNVTFTASYNDSADPFSTCNMLNTLIIDHCALRHGTRALCISNSNLSSLVILDTFNKAGKIELSTPKLSSLTIISDPIHQLTACNLPILEEVYIYCRGSVFSNSLVLLSWLQLIANNVKKMTLCSKTLEIINDLSTLDSTKTQPPCFGSLKSFEVKMNSYPKLSDEGIRKTVAYLLQNSPVPRVDIINCRI